MSSDDSDFVPTTRTRKRTKKTNLKVQQHDAREKGKRTKEQRHEASPETSRQKRVLRSRKTLPAKAAQRTVALRNDEISAKPMSSSKRHSSGSKKRSRADSPNDEEDNPPPKRIKTRRMASKINVLTLHEYNLCVNHTGVDTPFFDNSYYRRRIELKGAPQGTLRSEIHPLLTMENFPIENLKTGPAYKKSGRILNDMALAFRLASRFLTHRALAEPWIYTMLAKPTFDAGTGLMYLTIKDADVPKLHADESFARFQKELLSLKVKFLFVPVILLDKDQIQGLHFLPGEDIQEDPKNTEIALRSTEEKSIWYSILSDHHRIAINAVYWEYFSKAKQERDPVQDVRTTYSLAVTIIHEIFHVWYLRNSVYNPDDPEDSNNKHDEPFYNLEDVHTTRKPELGDALEKQLFGQKMDVTMYRWKGARIGTENESFARHREVTVVKGSYWQSVLDVDWMYSLLTERFWKRVTKMEDLRVDWPRYIMVRPHLRDDDLRWKKTDLGSDAAERRSNVGTLMEFDRQEVEKEMARTLSQIEKESVGYM